MLELGLAVDGAVKGRRVCVVQFLSNAEQAASLARITAPMAIDICRCEREEELAAACALLGSPEGAKRAMERAAEVLRGREYELVVLSEAATAVACGYVGLEELVKLVEGRPAGVDVVLTGSCVDPILAHLADGAVELVPVRAKGDVIDRLGLEYWRAGEEVLQLYMRQRMEEGKRSDDGRRNGREG